MFCYFDAISTSDKQIDATLTYTNVENLLDPEEGGGYLGKCENVAHTERILDGLECIFD